MEFSANVCLHDDHERRLTDENWLLQQKVVILNSINSVPGFVSPLTKGTPLRRKGNFPM